MTIEEALSRVERERPGESTEAEKLRWLSMVDMQWFQDQILTHEREQEEDAVFTGYGVNTDRGTELLIPLPYDEVYVHYLFAMADQKLGEVERYQNDAALFNQMLDEAQRAYTRAHMPKERGYVRHVFGMKG